MATGEDQSTEIKSKHERCLQQASKLPFDSGRLTKLEFANAYFIPGVASMEIKHHLNENALVAFSTLTVQKVIHVHVASGGALLCQQLSLKLIRFLITYSQELNRIVKKNLCFLEC